MPAVESQAVTAVNIRITNPESRFSCLVVDDDPASRKLLGQILSSLGCPVQEARDGAEAVVAWQANRPDIVWMDIRLPHVDGREAVRRIQDLSRGEKPLIVAVTASAFEEERQALLDSGFDQVLHKPYSEEQIEAILIGRQGLTEEPGPVDLGRAGKIHAGISRDALQRLPEEWVAALKQAAHLADAQAVEALLAKIQEVDPQTAGYLKSLSDAYRFDLVEETLSKMSL